MKPSLKAFVASLVLFLCNVLGVAGLAVADAVYPNPEHWGGRSVLPCFFCGQLLVSAAVALWPLSVSWRILQCKRAGRPFDGTPIDSQDAAFALLALLLSCALLMAVMALCILSAVATLV